MSELNSKGHRITGFAKLLFGVILLLAGFAVQAAEDRWSGEGELGFGLTDGNTDTRNANVGITLKHLMRWWENSYVLEALNESQNDTTSAEKYAVKLQSNRKMSDDNFLFGALSYDDDRFSGFDYEWAVSIGYGRRIINAEAMQLDFEVGPGYRFTEVKDAGSEEEGIVRTALKFNYDLSENARFTQSLINTAGEKRVITESDSGISAQVVGNLAMKLSLKVRHNSEPADATREKTDTETAFTLVYGF
jgi:putative salt-induced outer membrane protein